MSSIFSAFPVDPRRAYIAPLFWQRGERPEVLREEIRQMAGAGVDAFVVESRPHPDFLGPGWWDTLDVILDEARRHGLKVWIFDDKIYPTGYANGAIPRQHPRLRKQFIRQQHVEAVGPVAGSSFRVTSWLGEGETLYAAVAARRTDGGEGIDPKSLVELTSRVKGGVLYWDVPEGHWRVCFLVRTHAGGEDWTKDHVNPIDPASVKVLIETVYEAHWRRYGAEFGRTIAGFFNDEPRFGNASTYDGRLGQLPMVLPFSERLPAALKRAWGGDFTRCWPALWMDAGELSARARYTYMNVVSRLYGEHFSRQIGDWCGAHGVQWIGHAVEDSGAHARLGYGSGHFFRALSGQHGAGMDTVYQIWPEFRDGRVTSPFGYLDARFFYWGIAKLASSAGHIDPRKKGITACELFGAYGWQLGLKMMKWLTDHVCVRGVNLLIPHAFSPKDFPDPDCPPHFYARGHNPQWRHFGVWSGYAGRLCRLLSGGVHVATAAVLYHAEAEWAGEYEPFERVIQTLHPRQIDCDVVPADTLVDARACALGRGLMRINGEEYAAIIVPYSQYLPARVLARLREAAGAGVRVVFMRKPPEWACDDPAAGRRALARLRRHRNVSVTDYGQLVRSLHARGLCDVRTATSQPDLRVYHYRRDGRDLYLLVNESTRRAVDTRLRLRNQSCEPAAYDALQDRLLRTPHRTVTGGVEVPLRLEPFQSLLLVFPGGQLLDGAEDITAQRPAAKARSRVLRGPWQVAAATAEQYPHFTPAPVVKGLGNVARPGLLPTFSGTLRYATSFGVAGSVAGHKVWLDLGQVYEVAAVRLNGKDWGARICPPYRFEIASALVAGANDLEIEVTNTLAKSHGDNTLDRAHAQEPTGLIGPVRLLGL